MEINFKDFVVLYDKTSYESYKAACVEKLLGEGSEAIPQAMASDSTVQFPDPPERYPCLVASLVRDKPSLKEGEFVTYRIFSCYVYKEDAKSLLSAEATLDQSIIEDVPGLDADEEMLVSNRPPLADAALDINRELYEPPVPNEDEIKVLFSSVVALLAELKAIGALDIKRFKKEADKAAIPLKYEKLNSVAKLLNFLKDEFNVG
jgi:hypothetical protein